MKLILGFVALAAGANLSRENAASMLRVRRANEGWFSETVSGDLERECIEESCDDQEFHEVYDDRTISEPKYSKYLDCLNYINKSQRSTEAGKEQLRGCIKASNHGPQRPQEPIATQRPDPGTPRPTQLQTNQFPQYTQKPQNPNSNQFPGTIQDKNEGLPSCSAAGWGFLCGELIPYGFPNKNDPLFQHIGNTLQASLMNRVHCKLIPQKGYSGNRVLNCTMNYETGNRNSCSATAMITQKYADEGSSAKIFINDLQSECVA